jgi:hypothetical protein
LRWFKNNSAISRQAGGSKTDHVIARNSKQTWSFDPSKIRQFSGQFNGACVSCLDPLHIQRQRLREVSVKKMLQKNLEDEPREIISHLTIAQIWWLVKGSECRSGDFLFFGRLNHGNQLLII